MQVLEEEHDRELLREPLEEQSPGTEELFLAPGAAFFETEKMRKPRLGEAALLCIGHVLLEGRPQLGAGGGGFFAFHDPGPHPDHLGQCPERHSLAVGKTPAPVPPDLIDEPVEVLVELPAEPRLADAGDPDDRDELRLSLLGAGVVELLHESQLAVATDEWRLEPGGLERASPAGGHSESPEELLGLGLPLQLVLACVLVGDRRFGGPARRSPDEDCAGLGGALDARRGVDEVAGDHALALSSDRDCGLPRENACACLQGCVELWHSGDEVEPGPDGALSVVLLGDRCSPDGHDGIADELLDCAAIAVDDGSRRLEVEREKLARVLRVALCGCGGEADEVGEEDGDEAAFSRWRAWSGSNRNWCCGCPERRPAFPTELHRRCIRRSTRRTRLCERCPAFAAELPAGLVRRAACWTGNRLGHGPTLVPMTMAAQCARLRSSRGLGDRRRTSGPLARARMVAPCSGGAAEPAFGVLRAPGGRPR